LEESNYATNLLLEKIHQMDKKIENLQNTNHTNNLLLNNYNNYSTNTLNNTIITNNNQKTINVVAYINSNYTEAEPLTLIKREEVTKLLKMEDTDGYIMEDYIVFNYSKHLIDTFIGDLIVKEYKKQDPKTQKLWSSDTSRLTFIVRQVLNENEKIWLQDKKGICVIKYIIGPVLEEVKLMMKEYSNKCFSEMMSGQSNDMQNLTDKISSSTKLIYDINQKEIHQKILNYIAPYFQIDLS
jgi:hypothetical protein